MRKNNYYLSFFFLSATLLSFFSQPAQSQLQGSFDGYMNPFRPPLPQVRKLAPTAVHDEDAVRFQLEVYDSPGVVVAEFMSSTCLACNGASRMLKDLQAHYGNKVKFVRIEANKNIGICEQFGVKRVPSVVVFNEGDVVDKFSLYKQPDKDPLCRTIDLQIEKSRLAKEELQQPVNLEPIRLVE
jgi:thioredoxin 1